MKDLDFFSSIYGFTYDKSVKYQTNFGTLLSIIFVSLYMLIRRENKHTSQLSRGM